MIEIKYYEELLKMIKSNNIDDITLAAMYLEDKPDLPKDKAAEFCAVLSAHAIPLVKEGIDEQKGWDNFYEMSSICKKLTTFSDWMYRKAKITPTKLGEEIRRYVLIKNR